jgi:hypothetical protein
MTGLMLGMISEASRREWQECIRNNSRDDGNAKAGT